MTQVKEMSNKQIDVALAILCGYEIYAEEFSTSHELVVRYENSNSYKGLKFFSPCTDPAASLEVQTAAYSKHPVEYMRNVAEVQGWKAGARVSIEEAGQLANPSFRERAEAAYLTLSQVSGQ